MRGELKKPPPVVVVVVAALFSFLNVIIPNFLSLETKNTRFGLVLYLYQFGIWRLLFVRVECALGDSVLHFRWIVSRHN